MRHPSRGPAATRRRPRAVPIDCYSSCRTSHFRWLIGRPPKGARRTGNENRSHAGRARQGLWKRRDSRVDARNRCRATPPSARTGLIDDSERRTLTIILPVVKQVECHLARLESTIENKGLMDVLHGRGEALRAL